jgi:TolB-like protein/Tfp pilus assembly protein PilF
MEDQEMEKKVKFHPITIDLNQFKLRVSLKDRIELTLHFNSSSRRFYLSVIAFVVNEMKRLGKIRPIPLGMNHDILALLNDTVGGSAGSSDKEKMLPRIYRKWQHALPNLEEAPLFKVLGKKKEYDEGAGKTYPFTEAEKDRWANLFEYEGSEENIRLKFAIDKIGAGLDDVEIIYEDSLDGEAWDRFISELGENVKIEPEKEEIDEGRKEPVSPAFPLKKWKRARPIRYRWATLIVAIGVVVGAAAVAIWGLDIRHALLREITPAPPELEVASRNKMVFPLPDKPSIAVLPFVNMSGDKEQEYFSDGLTEEIINALSRTTKLFVIAQNSTFTYKGTPVKISQVAEELGVRYVLEGSVRKAGNRVRIAAQLIDALTGRHVWADRYDRDLKDIFAIQDEITIKIIGALQVKLTDGEMARFTARGTQNLEAYLKVLQAQEAFYTVTKEGMVQARGLCEEAIALDPGYAIAYGFVGTTHWMEVILGSSKSSEESLKLAFEFLEKAKALSGSLPVSNLGFLYFHTGDRDRGIAECERAVALAPNSGRENIWMALVYHLDGRHEEAVRYVEQALRFDPLGPAWYLRVLGQAYSWVGRYEEAIAAYKKSLQRAPKDILTHLHLATTYTWADRQEDAHAQVTEVLKINPKYSVEQAAKASHYKNKADRERYLDALRKAGLPESPPPSP